MCHGCWACSSCYQTQQPINNPTLMANSSVLHEQNCDPVYLLVQEAFRARKAKAEDKIASVKRKSIEDLIKDMACFPTYIVQDKGTTQKDQSPRKSSDYHPPTLLFSI